MLKRLVEKYKNARHWWFMPIILATQEAEMRRIRFEASMGNSSARPCLQKPFTKIGLVEWLKVKTLSSNPRTTKKKKKRKIQKYYEQLIYA
jgi:hypothetical protein